MYLVPDGLKLLVDKLHVQLRGGARIISYVFSIPDLNPVATRVYKGSTKLYLYTLDSLI